MVVNTVNSSSSYSQETVGKFWMDFTKGKNRFHASLNLTDGTPLYSEISYQKDQSDAYTFIYQLGQCTCTFSNGMAIARCEEGNATTNSDGTITLDYRFQSPGNQTFEEIIVTLQPLRDNEALFTTQKTYYKQAAPEYLLITSETTFSNPIQMVTDTDLGTGRSSTATPTSQEIGVAGFDVMQFVSRPVKPRNCISA